MKKSKYKSLPPLDYYTTYNHTSSGVLDYNKYRCSSCNGYGFLFLGGDPTKEAKICKICKGRGYLESSTRRSNR